MALQRVCVRCGKTPAHRVEASLALWNVAEDDQPTGVVYGDDACADCQEAVVETLQKHTIETLREQAPIHRALILTGRERDIAQRELDEHVRLVRADAEQAEAKAAEANAARARTGKPGVAAEDFRTPEILSKHAELAQRVAEHETKRQAHLDSGNALAVKRTKVLAADLKGPKSSAKAAR